MARTKNRTVVIDYKDSGYVVNDFGENKSPRFELFYEPTNKTIMKTNNPLECTAWMKKNVWKEFYE